MGFHENQIVIGEYKSVKITIMSLLSENVIPGNHGKVFGTNAKEPQTLENQICFRADRRYKGCGSTSRCLSKRTDHTHL